MPKTSFFAPKLTLITRLWPARAAMIEKEDTMNPPTALPAARSGAAERMRAHRQRRRDGLRCLTIELRETEIDALIRKELLKPETRNDLSAIIDALYVFLDRTLGATP
jgi:hypothetical protein